MFPTGGDGRLVSFCSPSSTSKGSANLAILAKDLKIFDKVQQK
jgi:hypothetical protein